MRRRSGSIVVTSVSHGVWNSLAYVLFGEGTAIGVLGIHNTVVFGPEVGVVGLVLNLAFAAILWVGFSRIRATAPGRIGLTRGRERKKTQGCGSSADCKPGSVSVNRPGFFGGSGVWFHATTDADCSA